MEITFYVFAEIPLRSSYCQCEELCLLDFLACLADTPTLPVPVPPEDRIQYLVDGRDGCTVRLTDNTVGRRIVSQELLGAVLELMRLERLHGNLNLDEQVTLEVMQWKIHDMVWDHQRGDVPVLTNDPKDYPTCARRSGALIRYIDPNDPGVLWTPSKDMNQALQVAKRLCWVYRIEMRLKLDKGGLDWRCGFWDRHGFEIAGSVNDSPAVAVCKAAVRTMETRDGRA